MKRLAILAFMLIAPVAFGGIEKLATGSKAGINFMWWPKVDPPRGWHHDEGSSRHYAFNAIAPDGSTFSNAETVLYAKANFKPRSPEVKTLQAFIESDVSQQKADEPEIIVTPEPSIRGKGALTFTVVHFEPGNKKSTAAWERVAYADDGDYFLTFAVSSHSKHGLDSSGLAFKALLLEYTPGP